MLTFSQMTIRKGVIFNKSNTVEDINFDVISRRMRGTPWRSWESKELKQPVYSNGIGVTWPQQTRSWWIIILYCIRTSWKALSVAMGSHLNEHYANDCRLLFFCRPDEQDNLKKAVAICINNVSYGMPSIRLKLNLVKTEILWGATSKS